MFIRSYCHHHDDDDYHHRHRHPHHHHHLLDMYIKSIYIYIYLFVSGGFSHFLFSVQMAWFPRELGTYCESSINRPLSIAMWVYQRVAGKWLGDTCQANKDVFLQCRSLSGCSKPFSRSTQRIRKPRNPAGTVADVFAKRWDIIRWFSWVCRNWFFIFQMGNPLLRTYIGNMFYFLEVPYANPRLYNEVKQRKHIPVAVTMPPKKRMFTINLYFMSHQQR